MSPAWCEQAERDLAPVRDFRQRAVDLYPESVTAVSQIVVAVNTAGDLALQGGHQRTWTGEAAQRVWGSAYDDLRALSARGKNRGLPLLQSNDIDRLAKTTLKLTETVLRLFAEMAPATINAAPEEERQLVELKIKRLELILNAVIVPQLIAAHGEYVDLAGECLKNGWECREQAEKLPPVMQMISQLVTDMCKLSDKHAPGANPYAALLATQFEADCKDAHRLTT